MHHSLAFLEEAVSKEKTISTMAPASASAYIWPTTGAIGFQMEHPLHAFIVGAATLIAIPFTFAVGYRCGFIITFSTN